MICANTLSILITLLALSAGVAQAAGGHASALGKPGDPAKVDRSIEIATSDDMRFSPNEVRVKRGQTIRFRVVNGGQMKHEMVLGTLDELQKHAALMRKFPEMEHDDPNAVSIEPGQDRRTGLALHPAGDFDFACLVPGHFEAGMRGKIVVRP
jgi:uncharacterized cupredoxin-like copper-binding protein